MKKFLQILLFSLTANTLYSQNIVSIGSFPVLDYEKKPIQTVDLLNKINWTSIRTYSGGGHYVREDVDSLITTYEYVKQGRSSYFEIKSFNGLILQFESEISTQFQNSKSSYFDKTVWLSYVSAVLPKLPFDCRLSYDEPAEILKAYYQLLGIETRDEYGWYCEYSAIGRPTARRLAVIQLIKYKRQDLLKKLLNYQNTQTQLYAADALIYLDFETKEKIASEGKSIVDKQNAIDSLRSLPTNEKETIQSLRDGIKYSKDFIKILNDQLLTNADWKEIYALRDSNKDVKTCRDGTGSYKIYSNKTSDLLSAEAILEIPNQYERFKSCGFFR
jgi:hypothetical protein